MEGREAVERESNLPKSGKRLSGKGRDGENAGKGMEPKAFLMTRFVNPVPHFPVHTSSWLGAAGGNRASIGISVTEVSSLDDKIDVDAIP